MCNNEFISNFEDELDSIMEGGEVILNEIGVYRDDRYNFSITVDGDGLTSHNFIKDPYFKVYDSKSSGKGEPIRIAFKDGKARYIIHNNNYSTLDKKIRKQLDVCMDKIDPDSGLSVWEILKRTTCTFAGGSKEDINRVMSYKKPDFDNDLKGVKLR